ncbi:hypothetical protein F5148DRAFT_134402 [Russula earlei]|uniref:Uncharacterized protein n=1 Tax=Russula earlei TaxID=71964 RepID=A0ACC0U6M5_9AGAM|nr:hypothetical protein F5148DRAFT_134402 [Russula earlei]
MPCTWQAHLLMLSLFLSSSTAAAPASPVSPALVSVSVSPVVAAPDPSASVAATSALVPVSSASVSAPPAAASAASTATSVLPAGSAAISLVSTTVVSAAPAAGSIPSLADSLQLVYQSFNPLSPTLALASSAAVPTPSVSPSVISPPARLEPPPPPPTLRLPPMPLLPDHAALSLPPSVVTRLAPTRKSAQITGKRRGRRRLGEAEAPPSGRSPTHPSHANFGAGDHSLQTRTTTLFKRKFDRGWSKFQPPGRFKVSHIAGLGTKVATAGMGLA